MEKAWLPSWGSRAGEEGAFEGVFEGEADWRHHQALSILEARGLRKVTEHSQASVLLL